MNSFQADFRTFARFNSGIIRIARQDPELNSSLRTHGTNLKTIMALVSSANLASSVSIFAQPSSSTQSDRLDCNYHPGHIHDYPRVADQKCHRPIEAPDHIASTLPRNPRIVSLFRFLQCGLQLSVGGVFGRCVHSAP